MSGLGLYIHYPFCTQKCSYCDFLSFNTCKGDQKDLQRAYFKALCHHIKVTSQFYDVPKVKSIFLGGGTPSLMTEEEIKTLLLHLKNHFKWSEDCEVTIECNPETLTYQRLVAYKTSGINRLSLGLQSTNNAILKVIGRRHDYEQFISVYQMARQVGFDNINIDLMFNLPLQNRAVIETTIEDVVALDPDHLSIYSLKLEAGTLLSRQVERGVYQIEDAFEDRVFYHEMLNLLSQAGYHQYEISNVAKPGYECRHNKVYWKNENYLPLGLGAHGKMPLGKEKTLTRYHITDQMETFLSSETFEDFIQERERIDLEEDLFETIILGLRLNEGLHIDAINNKYAIDFLSRYSQVIKKYRDLKMMVFKEGNLRLTPLGMDLSNQIFVDFMDE